MLNICISTNDCLYHFSCDHNHYSDIIMGAIASQITGLTIVYSTIYPDADQRKHQSSASLAFVRGIHRGHKGPVTQKMFPFDDVIMIKCQFFFSLTKGLMALALWLLISISALIHFRFRISAGVNGSTH